MYRHESGQVVVFVAIAMAALVAIGALAVDVGWMQLQKRKLQAIADNAVVEAAGEMRYDPAHAGYIPGTNAALNLASQMGFINGVDGANLAVNCPPSSGPHAGAGSCTGQSYVEVVATKTGNSFFSKIFGVNAMTISARAVAWTGASGGCVYALNPSMASAILFTGSSIFSANCGIIDDSSNAYAFSCSGSSNVTATQIGVVGGASTGGSCNIQPTPTSGIAYVSDPLGYLAPPAASCPTTPPHYPSGCSYAPKKGLTCNSSVPGDHIQAGTYCGGITLNAGVTESFDPGLYVLAGGSGLDVNGSATVTGNGVTFYHATDPSGTAPFTSMKMNGSSTTRLTAPTSGNYAAILFYEDRRLAANGVNLSQIDNTFNGGNGATFQGSLYFPTTHLTYLGTSTANAAYMIMVADSITFSGNTTVRNNYSSLPQGSPIQHVVTTE